MHLSVLVLDVPVSLFCPEGGKCLGVDVSAGRVAPLDEVGGPYFCLDQPTAVVAWLFSGVVGSVTVQDYTGDQPLWRVPELDGVVCAESLCVHAVKSDRVWASAHEA